MMKSAAAAVLLLGLAASPAAACGWENERCCSTKKGGVACKVDGLVCIGGRCKPEPVCGGDGEACCAGETCDLHSLVCLSGSCTPCGKLGEPVCNGARLKLGHRLITATPGLHTGSNGSMHTTIKCAQSPQHFIFRIVNWPVE